MESVVPPPCAVAEYKKGIFLWQFCGPQSLQALCLLHSWDRMKSIKQSFKLEIKISTQNSKYYVEVLAAWHISFWFIFT